MKIGIVGNGYVGGATALLKSKDLEVLIFDKNPLKCSPLGTLFKDLVFCDFVFVCVPTPMKEDGSCETKIVEDCVNHLINLGLDKGRIIIKSTVPVGTSKRLGVCFIPEFLTEKNWERDFLSQKRWIYGCDVQNDRIRDELYSLFKQAYKNKILLNDPEIKYSSTEEAELCKYARNCFLAVKVSFFNEINEFCQGKNINFNKVRELTCLDDRIGDSHSKVPGPDGKNGYGGTCFPKDIKSLFYQIQNDTSMESYIIESAVHRNENIDRVEQDWKLDKGRVIL